MIRGFMQIKLFEKESDLMIKGYRSFCLKTIKELHSFIHRLNSSYIWNLYSPSTNANPENNKPLNYFITVVKGSINELNYEFIFSIESPGLDHSFFDELIEVSENIASIVSSIFANLARNDTKKEK